MTECVADEVDDHVLEVQRIMRLAARVAIGAEIPVDSAVTKWPDRYRGEEIFDTIVRMLAELENEPRQ